MPNFTEILDTLAKITLTIIFLPVLFTCLAALLYACGITWYMMYDVVFGAVTVGVSYD